MCNVIFCMRVQREVGVGCHVILKKRKGKNKKKETRLPDYHRVELI